jgi:hypothetical protein
MTIQDSTNGGIIHSGNDVATSFSFPFKVNTTSQIRVVVRDALGVEVVKVLNTDYTVTNHNIEGSGSITYPVSGDPLASTDSIAISPKMDYLQSTDLRNQGKFAPETHEDAFDTLMMHIKELKGRVDRAALFKESSGLSGAEFGEDPVDGYAIGWDGITGKTKNLTGLSSSIVASVTAFMKTVLDDVDAASARSTLDAEQLLNALTAITTLQGVDQLAIADNSDSDLTRKITYENFLKSSKILPENILLNPDFLVQQDGASFAAMATSTYIADGYVYTKTGTMVHTGSIETDVPTFAQAGRNIPYSIKLDCTTADAVLGAGDFTNITTHIEGYDFKPLSEKAFFYGVWVKGTKTGIHCASARNSGSDRSYIGEYTINVSDTWEYKTILFIASPSAGSWNYTTGVGLSITLSLGSGSTFHTTADAWQTGNFHSTANQVNASDNIANNFLFCGGHVIEGALDLPYRVRGYAEEIKNCLYFYRKIIANGMQASAQSTITAAAAYRFEMPMRIAPAMSGDAVSGFRFSNATNNYVASAISFAPIGVQGFVLSLTISGVTANSAGLVDNISGGYVYANSRL